jgi:hypothetical protein
MKPNVVFHGQSEDQPEEIIETSSSLSSPCSTHHQTRANTRVRTINEEFLSTKVAKKENQQEAPQVESTEEWSEEREDPLRQLTIDETCSLPENFHFPIIDDLEVKVHDAEDGEGRRAREAQSDPEYKPADQEDDGSSEEDDGDSHDLDFTLQTPRKTENTQMCAAKTDRISNSSKPKNGATMHPHKTSKTRSDNTKDPSFHPVKCRICHKQFKGRSAKYTLKRHLNFHAAEPKFPCPRCPERFKQRYPRQQHIKRVHLKMPVKTLACEYCDKKFAYPYQKKQHELVRNLQNFRFQI